MNDPSIARAWRDSVLDAVVRLSSRHGTLTIQRQALVTEELDRIVEETRSDGATPAQTLSRLLQNLRDEGVLEFLGDGAYRVTKQPVDVELADLTIRRSMLPFENVYCASVVWRQGPPWLRSAGGLVKPGFVCWCFRTTRVVARCVTCATHISSWRATSSRGPTPRMREVILAISSVCAVSTTPCSRMATGHSRKTCRCCVDHRSPVRRCNCCCPRRCPSSIRLAAGPRTATYNCIADGMASRCERRG